MAIQNDSTLLCKGDLKAYHESIAPYLGGNLMVTTNVSDYYSEDEKIVGVWLDGKPLYQKTYFTNDLENATTLQTKNISAGFPLSNRPERIVSTIGCWRVGSNPYTGGTIPYVDDNYVMNAQLSGSQGYVQILYKGDWRNTDVYITLQYTKTGDTATSALTTPGCYDLNRPDLWPDNQEIFFGSGLYGARVTGSNVTIAADGQLDRETSSIATKIINCGGAFSIDEGLSEVCVPCGYASAFSSGFWINNNGKLLYWIKNERTSSVTALYDAWVLYKK